MEEILCCIGAVIFSTLAVVFGVRNRLSGNGGSSSSRTGSGIYSDRSRYHDLVSDRERLEQLEQRATDSIERVNSIKQRIRKREQPASTAEPEADDPK